MKSKVPNQSNTCKITMVRSLSVILILFSSLSFAQFGKGPSLPDFRMPPPIIYEAIPYWSNDTATIDLVILYRVSPSFLIFAKTETASRQIFEAKGELIIEIQDVNDATVVREIRPMRLERNSMPPENTPPSDEIQGALTFKLKKGSYRIIVEAKDSESTKSFTDRDTKVDIKSFSLFGLNISQQIFTEPPQTDTSVHNQMFFVPTNRGGNVLIGQTGGCLFQVVSPDTSNDIHLSWKLLKKIENDEEIPQEFNGDQYLQQIGTPDISEKSNRISYDVRDSSKKSRVVYVPIPTERLQTGKYKLSTTVTQDTLKSTGELSFSIIWPLKPRSLSSFKISIDALKYIATEEEIEQITSSGSAHTRRAFHEFWQNRNPDTTSAFNPVMAEYYRRVDESILRFSSANEIDGYKSDRGRIYILFGSPTFTNRLLKPNTSPTEIWTYENLNKRFTFTDRTRSGNYILVNTEDY